MLAVDSLNTILPHYLRKLAVCLIQEAPMGECLERIK